MDGAVGSLTASLGRSSGPGDSAALLALRSEWICSPGEGAEAIEALRAAGALLESEGVPVDVHSAWFSLSALEGLVRARWPVLSPQLPLGACEPDAESWSEQEIQSQVSGGDSTSPRRLLPSLDPVGPSCAAVRAVAWSLAGLHGVPLPSSGGVFCPSFAVVSPEVEARALTVSPDETAKYGGAVCPSCGGVAASVGANDDNRTIPLAGESMVTRKGVQVALSVVRAEWPSIGAEFLAQLLDLAEHGGADDAIQKSALYVLRATIEELVGGSTAGEAAAGLGNVPSVRQRELLQLVRQHAVPVVSAVCSVLSAALEAIAVAPTTAEDGNILAARQRCVLSFEILHLLWSCYRLPLDETVSSDALNLMFSAISRNDIFSVSALACAEELMQRNFVPPSDVAAARLLASGQGGDTTFSVQLASQVYALVEFLNQSAPDPASLFAVVPEAETFLDKFVNFLGLFLQHHGHRLLQFNADAVSQLLESFVRFTFLLANAAIGVVESDPGAATTALDCHVTALNLWTEMFEDEVERQEDTGSPISPALLSVANDLANQVVMRLQYSQQGHLLEGAFEDGSDAEDEAAPSSEEKTVTRRALESSYVECLAAITSISPFSMLQEVGHII
jgi:hypothetical protein